MANGDDGFSEVGGGGSVGWRVSVNNGNLPQTTRKPDPAPWGYEIHDTDDVKGHHGEPDPELYKKFFHIEILEPASGNVAVAYDPKTRKFHIFLPIENRNPNPGHPRQIRVMWAAARKDVETLIQQSNLELVDVKTKARTGL